MVPHRAGVSGELAATAAELLLQVLNQLTTNQRLPRALRREICEAMKDIRAGQIYEVVANDDLEGQNEWIGEGMNTRKQRKSEWKKGGQDSYASFNLKLESPGPVATRWFSDLRSSVTERAPQREF